VRLVKVDVEGGEMPVLQGMQRFLAKAHPEVVVAVEIAPDRLANGMADARAIFAMMQGLGFRAYTIENDYLVAEYVAPRLPAKLTPVATPLARQSDYVFSRSERPLA
jgi:hypothetical protein